MDDLFVDPEEEFWKSRVSPSDESINFFTGKIICSWQKNDLEFQRDNFFKKCKKILNFFIILKETLLFKVSTN